MLWSKLKIAPKNFIGLDIGTTSLKIVELSSAGEKVKLENYGEVDANAFYEKNQRSFEKNTSFLNTKEIAIALQSLLKATGIQGREIVFAIPDFSSFFTTFKLPNMGKDEIASAVRFEARQHIPLPLSEVVLDWSVINEKALGSKSAEGPEILLVAVPQEVINRYQEIADTAQVKILALEAEVFGLVRALVPEKTGVTAILDIGSQTSTVNIIDEGLLKRSHTFDISGSELTRVLSSSLKVDYNEAEGLKKRHGIRSSEMKVTAILQPIVDIVVAELERANLEYGQTTNKTIEKIIVSGGSALLPGLKDYLALKLKKPVEIANPFREIFYPSVLDPIVKEIGPGYTVAVGMALRGFDNKHLYSH